MQEFSTTQRGEPRRGAGDEERLEHLSSGSWHREGRKDRLDRLLACVGTAGTAWEVQLGHPVVTTSRDTKCGPLGAGLRSGG